MRDEIAKTTEALGILDPNIMLLDLKDERSSAWAQYSVVVDDEKFINQFKRNEIPYAIHYPDVLTAHQPTRDTDP